MPRDNKDEVSEFRQALVDGLIAKGLIASPLVEAAFREVPRHLFVPGTPLDKVYSDESVITKREGGIPISSSSQPAIMAIMLEQLGLEPGHRVLEIGAGTGYNAALMARIVGDTGLVVTMDIDEDIVVAAIQHLSAAGFDKVQVVYADGGFGYPDAAPYDRIILTVGAWDIVPEWQQQLGRGGRLLLPLSIGASYQLSVAFEQADDHLESVSVKYCGFMLLRGALAGPEWYVPIGPKPGLSIGGDDREMVDPDAIHGLLTGTGTDLPTGVWASTGETQFGGLGLWLALNQPGLSTLHAEGEQSESVVVPWLFRVDSGGWKAAWARALLGPQGMAVVTRDPRVPSHGERSEASERFKLVVRSYGSDGSPGARLIEQIKAWDSAGRPYIEGLRLRAYPQGNGYSPSAKEYVVDKKWTRLVADWP